MSIHYTSQTIIAPATPPGIGALGIIRLSGPDAIKIVNTVFIGKDLEAQPTHTIHFGRITDKMPVGPDRIIDEVVVSLYKGPRSYTGEDIAEISCHGSGYILEQVMAVCIANGAVMAKAGEFTQRAFLHGKMDLTQAEAVADLIASESSAAQQAAMHNLRGGFSIELKQMREELIQFSALIELELDFSQEDVEFADRTKFYELVDRAAVHTQALLTSFSLGNVIKKGVSVAIVGKPNAGKSTLLNALLNEERAIVSDIAGTTRDTIEETLNINGILFRLIDTAGIRSSKGDTIEDIGIGRSKDNAARADIVIHLIDITDGNRDDMDWLEEYAAKTVHVYNKYDAAGADYSNAKGKDTAANIYISAKERQGIDELKELLYHKIAGQQISGDQTIVTNARHYAALKEVNDSLKEIRTGLDTNLPGDLLSLDIRRCLHFLGDITGEVTTDDKLDYIFSKFCIGK